MHAFDEAELCATESESQSGSESEDYDIYKDKVSEEENDQPDRIADYRQSLDVNLIGD